jgi:Zn-dependent protease with chaperone function
MTHQGAFNDGKTAARRNVTLLIDGDALLICRADDGTEAARWPLVEIRRIGTSSERPQRFRKINDDARLTLNTDDDGTWLATACPKLNKRDAGRVRWPVWTGAGVLAVISVLGLVFFLLPGAAALLTGAIPVSLEMRIGSAYRDQLLDLAARFDGNGSPVQCRNPDGLRILQKRADEIASLVESPFPIQITVVRFPIANAFALPGGHVLILSELIKTAKSGDEVIGVLAHEIAHVVRRDAMQASMKSAGSALLVSLLIGDVVGGAMLAGGASAIIEGGYSRDAEAASDFIAVTALNQLGLSARPLADFLERIEKDEDSSNIMPTFLSTHPSGTDRARDIRALSQAVGRAMNAYDWRTLQKICD